MKKTVKISCLLIGLFLLFSLSSCQIRDKVRDMINNVSLYNGPITFTAHDYNAIALMPGTVTFPPDSNIPYLLKEDESLQEINGNTLEAGVIFRADFDVSTGKLESQGLICNFTDESQEIRMEFYDEGVLIAQATVHMNPRTFYHFIPDEIRSQAIGADKVVVSGLKYKELIQPILKDANGKVIRDGGSAAINSDHETGNNSSSDGYDQTRGNQFMEYTFYWQDPDDGESWSQFEFKPDGTFKFSEDNIVDYTECEGTYKMNGNKIELFWPSGYRDSMTFDESDYSVFYEGRFYR